MNNRKKVLGWSLFVIAIGFFCLQMGYFYLHAKFLIEYTDNRLFYVINIVIAIFLSIAIVVLLTVNTKGRVIGSSLLLLFIVLNGVLIFKHPINHIVSVSPDLKHVFVVKENMSKANYYRTYYGIFARQKETLPFQTEGEYKINWLEKDIAVLTYKALDDSIHQFIGTYGDRGNGISYYYVGSALHGEWKGKNGKVKTHTEGITIEVKDKKETYSWEHVVQFGTLAVVLVENEEAKWTIALNKDFKMDPSSGVGMSGTISLYKASMVDEEIFILKR